MNRELSPRSKKRLLLAGLGAGMLLLLIFFSFAHADSVYRWVDAQGHVHYSQTPPPNDATRARVMDVEPPPPDLTSLRQQQNLVKTVDAADAAQQKAAAQTRQEAQKKARQQQACAAARKQLQGYMEAHRVITHPKNGTTTYYTGDNLVKFREQARQQVNKVCGGA